MIDKNMATGLVKIARALDAEGEYEKANEVTELLERVAAGDKEAIRIAGDWWGDVKKHVSDFGKAGAGAAKGLWNAGKAGVGLAGDVARLPIEIPKAEFNAVKGGVDNYIKQVAAPGMNQQKQQNIHSLLAAAVAAHKSGQNGWKVLNAGMAKLPPNVQQQLKQKFMQSTGKYTA